MTDSAREALRDLVALVRIGFLVTVGGRRAEADDVRGTARDTLMAVLGAEDTEAALAALTPAGPEERERKAPNIAIPGVVSSGEEAQDDEHEVPTDAPTELPPDRAGRVRGRLPLPELRPEAGRDALGLVAPPSVADRTAEPPLGPEERGEGLREAIYLAPKLRLTGEQVAGITGGFSASDFDWDEHEDFVPMSAIEPFLAATPAPDTGGRVPENWRSAVEAVLHDWDVGEFAADHARAVMVAAFHRPPDTGAEERLRAALDALPTFEVGQVVGDLQPGRRRHDWCSVHGDIGPMESIDAHARRAHGASSAAIREARDTLWVLSGVSIDEEARP